MGPNLLFHSRAYEDGIEVRECMALDSGLFLIWDTGDWLTYQGRPVYLGEHINPRNPERLLDAWRRNDHTNPDVEVLHDAVH
jgi:hypothetical protein